MDSQGWDPGDLRLERGNRKVFSGSRRVNLHLHDGFSGGWKRKELMDSRRILWRSGKSRKERQGKSDLKVSLGPENDLELGNDMVGNGNHSVEEDVMEFDETRIDVEGNEKVISGDDEFQNLTDGEVEEPDNLQEVLDETKEVINYLGDAGDMGIAIGNEEKKNLSRKMLFKNTTLAEGTSKNRFSGAAASFRRLPEPLCVSLSLSLLLLLVISVFLSSAVEALLKDGSPFVVSGSSAHVGISVRWFFPCFGGVISESTVGEALECLSSGSLSSCVACGSCRSLGAELEPEVCESLASLFLLCSLPVVSGGNAFGPSEGGSQLTLVVVSWQRVDDGDSTACVCGFVYGVASLQSGRVSAQWKDINLASGFLTCLVDASPEEVFSTGLTALMSLGFNGCTGSWVGGSEAAVFGYLLRTTASSVAEPSSCCRLAHLGSRVFQGMRAFFSPVARADWLFILSMLRLLVRLGYVGVTTKVIDSSLLLWFFLARFWVTPVKRKQTKAGGSSKAEPPIKKQKKVSSIVEDEAAVEGKGASEKEGTEDIENKKFTAKAITIVAQASDVDFVTVSPSKDPAVGRTQVKV
ncbi:hypothetical protein Bca52824_059560 [Brassica carinata]|uniref:Uncharacterized protein n=1 Tax=Brassica carinata TaxID=52824 RepID=A0A8X7UET6_BRACI|nr:hypothetical protein Bca52824_059560 [Brassica carinata]